MALLLRNRTPPSSRYLHPFKALAVCSRPVVTHRLFQPGAASLQLRVSYLHSVARRMRHVPPTRSENASLGPVSSAWVLSGTARFLWSKKNVAAGVSESRRRPAADVIGNWSPDRQLPLGRHPLCGHFLAEALSSRKNSDPCRNHAVISALISILPHAALGRR